MRIDTGQHMRMSQQMKLAPRMIQSMEILQLSTLALEERIEQELASNPTLELREVEADREEIEAERRQDQRDASEGERELVVSDAPDASGKDDFERLTNLSEEYGDAWEGAGYEYDGPRRPRANTGERDAKIDAMANTASRSASLAEQMLLQWAVVETTPEVREAGELLISLLDADGYLRMDMAEVMQLAPEGMKEADVAEAWQTLKQIADPPGIGARDLRECLLLQIDARRQSHDHARNNGWHHNWSIERLLVAEHLKDIEMNRLPRIASALGIDIEQVKEALERLRQLQPHPGRLLEDDPPHAITPDAIIEYDEELDTYTARLTNDRLPNITINPEYSKMARDKTVDTRTREFVGNNLRSARWLLDAIVQRATTLLRVIHIVLEAQRDFFDLGPQHLHPLPMTGVAEQLGIHVATVSRAVSDKYIQTPRGIFPLRMFFSGGTETESGEAMSWAAVQAKLEQIIDEEDKSNPLSDEQLVDELKKHGIDIARRTVAKYRKQLNIAPARQRREF